MAEIGYWGRTLLGVSIAGIFAATLSLLVRLYVRRCLTKNLDISDLFMGLGLFAVTYTTREAAAFSGVGHDVSDLPQPIRRRAALLFWLDQILWVLAQVFVKLAITILLSRILGSMSGIRATTIGLIIFTIAWGISSVLAVIFQCWPVQRFWIQGDEGTCISGQIALYTAMGSLSLAEDIALLILPTVVVWRLRLISRLKIQLTVLFSVGTLVCIFSFLRLLEFDNYATRNLTRSGSLETIWTLLELVLAISCASVIAMPPLFRLCVGSCPLASCLRKSFLAFSSRSSDFVRSLR
ncbi:uncharacterized protein N7446_004988 [Penicillium canescens]|uniref:uncharacterized protein n=1 Tax=Penicillium canescens TaxID=5083 RepID=UPI0026DEE023|nr:uncharacterized protein N7446_004988 [Penicillium canescens]KAJ6067951.1 hypothetical protein N7446_004988 [Penicillium canescens]